MTRLLTEVDFFYRHFIEAGALAWSNGFDLGAGSLHRRLAETGALRSDWEATPDMPRSGGASAASLGSRT